MSPTHRTFYASRMKKMLASVGLTSAVAIGAVALGAGLTGAGQAPTGQQVVAATIASNDHEDKASKDKTAGAQHAQDMRAIAQAHQDGMKKWRACEKSKSTGCAKPPPPGWVKHPNKHPGGWPPHGESDKD
jgi:hypothetical protein